MADNFDAPRRVPTFPRQPEELHIPTANNPGTTNGPQTGQPQYASPPEYNINAPPSINVQQSGHPSSQYPANASTSNALPGTLQPGNLNRPGPLSSNTASTVPTLPQLSTHPPPPTTPSKSGQASQAHGYSRSSPPRFDNQHARGYSGHTPEGGKYASPTSQGPTPQNTTPFSPLGLADIRPHMEPGEDQLVGPMGQLNNGSSQFATNSNYPAPWGVYALDWCKWPTRPNSPSLGKVALGSYLEDHHNYIQILQAQRAQPEREYSDPESDPGLEFVKTAEATHAYPVTRILWEPASSQKQGSDLLATSGDHLRLWSLPSESSQSQHQGANSVTRSTVGGDPQSKKLSPLALLSNSKTPEHTAPITSLDWNVVSPSLIITSSIDTTCTIWDIPTLTAKTQLIAHDKEVFDVRFCANSVDVFVSCGADGSVRMFDLRSLEHSTIIYEPSEKNEKRSNSDSLSPTSQGNSPWSPPLLRIATSPHDAHLLGTFAQDSNTIRILDVRQPGQALLELKGHSAPVNCIEWSPTHRGTLASGADDCQVLIWDLINQNNAAPLPSQSTPPQIPQPQPQPQPHHPQHGGANVPPTMERGPAAVWRCDYEVSNISWGPRISGNNNENWLGVCGGRGLWGVSI